MLNDSDFANMGHWKLLSLRMIPFDAIGINGHYYLISAISGSFQAEVRVSKVMADNAHSVDTIVQHVIKKLDEKKEEMIELIM